MIDKVFPKKMKETRLEKDLSVEQLAVLTGRTTSYLFDIESGRRKGSIDTLVSISKSLGLSLDDIYGL